jgi:hypothetical protein
MADVHDESTTLSEDDIATVPLTAVPQSAVADDSTDTEDTGDDTGDVSDTSDTGDDTGEPDPV